jgi:imidazoleglycerol phosphate synthase glutamine amidotransferase subunit HisH
MIALIDYGSGNVRNVFNALKSPGIHGGSCAKSFHFIS